MNLKAYADVLALQSGVVSDDNSSRTLSCSHTISSAWCADVTSFVFTTACSSTTPAT